MSLQTVRQKIDDWLTPKWSNLVSKQDNYFTNNGVYFQGLWTHSAMPVQTDALDGDTIPDQLDMSPTDQPETWNQRFQNAFDNLLFPARLRIDVYEAPEGFGWFATLQVQYDGKIYQRSKGVGPVDYDEAWHDATPET